MTDEDDALTRNNFSQLSLWIYAERCALNAHAISLNAQSLIIIPRPTNAKPFSLPKNCAQQGCIVSGSLPLEMPDQFVLAIKVQHFFYVKSRHSIPSDVCHVIKDRAKKEVSCKQTNERGNE